MRTDGTNALPREEVQQLYANTASCRPMKKSQALATLEFVADRFNYAWVSEERTFGRAEVALWEFAFHAKQPC
jgi:hypothetical protein